MASTLTSLINHNFGGIRRKDSMFSDDKITCSDCQNVELFYTELNSAVGIRTVKGNIAINNLIPSGETVVGMYESTQDNITYFLVYTETTSGGKIYNLDLSGNTLTQLTTTTNATGMAQGTTFLQGWLDVFVFSNGKDIKFIYSNTTTHNRLLVAGETDTSLPAGSKLTVNLTDNDGRTVKGLGLADVYGRLWIYDGRVLWYSKQGAIADFYNSSQDTSQVTRAGYIEFTKDITAIAEYLGALAVFHSNSSSLIKQDSDTLFANTEESPGGCASYNALVFHGTDLFFYDDSKKGVFSFQQVINGDKTLGDNIAYDIQDELMRIKKEKVHLIRSLSVVTSDRNEVWFLIPISDEDDRSIIMIFDYIRGEWVKRKSQAISSIAVVDSVLYSGGSQIYLEYQTNTFNGEYINHYYDCTIMNMGTDNTLKITKFPPRLTVDASFKNHFFVKYIKNYNITKKPKIKELFSKTFGNTLKYDSGQHYDSGKTYRPGAISGIIKLPSATYKALDIMFYTNEAKQEFVIKSFEFSKIKIKQI